MVVWNQNHQVNEAVAHSDGGKGHEPLVTCPMCNRQVSCAPFCPFCGEELACSSALAPNEVRCPHCDAINEKDAKFCGNCGKSLLGPESDGAQPPEAK